MKGEIEVFAPSLLSVLFPGNGILHGGKQLESMLQWKWWKPSHEFLIILSSSSEKIGMLLYVQQYCYEIQQTTHYVFLKIMESNYGVMCTIRKTDTPSMVIQ